MDGTERWPRSVGGHVALDFANTEVYAGDEGADDVLRSAAEGLAWFQHAGLEPGAAALTRAQERGFLAAASSLRGAIRSIADAVAGGRDADESAMHALQAAWADAVRRAVPTLDGGRLSWAWEPAAPDAVLDALTGAAVELFASGPIERIKVCPGCGFLFLDATRNGSRRWCSMDDCGTEEKVRRYVEKRRASRDGT